MRWPPPVVSHPSCSSGRVSLQHCRVCGPRNRCGAGAPDCLPGGAGHGGGLRAVHAAASARVSVGRGARCGEGCSRRSPCAAALPSGGAPASLSPAAPCYGAGARRRRLPWGTCATRMLRTCHAVPAAQAQRRHHEAQREHHGHNYGAGGPPTWRVALGSTLRAVGGACTASATRQSLLRAIGKSMTSFLTHCRIGWRRFRVPCS